MPGSGRSKRLVERRQPREPRGRERGAVVTPVPRDDLLLPGPADSIVVVPRQLDLRVVGVRPRVAEEHARSRERRHADELVGKQDAGLVTLAREHVRERQLLDLLVRDARQLLVAVPERRAPQAGHGLDVAAPVVVPDVNPFAAHEHERSRAMQRGEIRVGVQDAREIRRVEIDVAHDPSEHDLKRLCRATRRTRLLHPRHVRSRRTRDRSAC